MYDKKTVIIVAITVLFAGILLGAGLGFYASNKASETLALSAELIHGKRSTSWSNRAFNVYMNGPVNLGIWALEGVAEEYELLLKDIIEYQLVYDKPTLYYDLMLTNARLAKLYNKTGNTDKVKFHEEKTLHYAQLAHPDNQQYKSLSNIMNAVEKIDENANKQPIQ